MRTLVCIIIAVFATPHAAAEITWHLELARSDLYSDTFSFESTQLPGERTVPRLRDNPSVATLGANVDLGGIPLMVAVFATGIERDFEQAYDLGPNLPALITVRHTLRGKGAHVAWSPVYGLSDDWELDGRLGLQYLERRIGMGQLGDQVRQSVTEPLLGAGVTWWWKSALGLRVGLDYTEGLRTGGIGVRLKLPR